MRVRELNDQIKCFCKHTFEEHHHGVVMNPEYADYPLNINGVIGQECEHSQVNGQYFKSKKEKPCMCSNFRPSSWVIQKLVKEWHAKHPRK